MSGTVMSPRRKKRFLKKTADFFYAGEELILAVAYRNVPGAVTAMMRSKPHPNTSLTGTVRRMVEMAAIGFALALVPEYVWDPLSESARAHLVRWLGGINDRDAPAT